MNRQAYMLAVLAAGGETELSPVQVQKLFFLLDKRIPGLVGGPHFSFAPYDYGPFDHAVYRELESLHAQGLVCIESPGTARDRSYRPSATGLARGKELLAGMSAPLQKYLADMSNWVRAQSFVGLVSAIYRDFPEMQANSVFRD